MPLLADKDLVKLGAAANGVMRYHSRMSLKYYLSVVYLSIILFVLTIGME